jgi:hypothetical protein
MYKIKEALIKQAGFRYAQILFFDIAKIFLAKMEKSEFNII